MNTSRRVIHVLLIILALNLAGACASRTVDQGGAGAEAVNVERGTLVSSITASGSAKSQVEVALAFETAGRIGQVLVEPGQQVVAGEPLALLDSADLELQVRSSEAALAAAQAELDQLLAGPRSEEADVARGQLAVAQAALDQAEAQRDRLSAGLIEAEIAAAEAAVKSARANAERTRAGPTAEEIAAAEAALSLAQAYLRQAQASYDLVKDRPDVQMLPQSLALQNATIELKRAQANYNAVMNHPTASELAAVAAQLAQAEAQLAQIKANAQPNRRAAEAAVAAAQAQRAIAQAQLNLLLAGPSDAQISAVRAATEQAQVALDRARLALDRAVLKAPFDTTVARVDVSAGEFANPQVPAITLLGKGQFRIEADIDETEIGWITVGQDTSITFDAFPDSKVAGKVVAIAPLASVDIGVVSYRVTIEIAPSDLPLRSGMTANAEIIREVREDVLLVPNLAIGLDGETGQKYVERQTPSGIERVEIETGLTTETYSEVTDGLAEGDVLVVTSFSAREQFREMMGASLTGEGQ